MKSILHELYFGHIIPWERRASQDPDYPSYNRKIEDEKRYFISKMSLDDCQRFQALENLYMQAFSYEEVDAFSHGFRMGAMLLIEVLTGKAHSLPYAEGFFDVAISIDSYHYYGADESYFPGIFSKLVKPGGQLGIVIPGLTREFEKGYPETMRDHWSPELFTFHCKDWWRHLWEKTGLAEITACYNIDDPKAIWQPWAVWAKEHLNFNDMEFLDADTGNDLALIAMTAFKRG